MPGEKIQKIPLRHQSDEFAMSRQMREVRQHDKLVADLGTEFAHFLVRLLKKVSKNAEFVHQLERGGMDRVAPKVTQKIAMFFEHHNVNTGACQQETQHHAGGTAADNAATGMDHVLQFIRPRDNSPPKLGGEPERKRGRGGSLKCR